MFLNDEAIILNQFVKIFDDEPF